MKHKSEWLEFSLEKRIIKNSQARGAWLQKWFRAVSYEIWEFNSTSLNGLQDIYTKTKGKERYGFGPEKDKSPAFEEKLVDT
ncbi:hypothetical protein RG959_20150 [Domibacillus sp. 8LH]|uniref:hypothetical protein n=1 Tax=Domibacillus sp. 8LH TaxID=3073900 RepID=UPI0031721F42